MAPGRRIKYTPKSGQKIIKDYPGTFAPMQGVFGLDFTKKFPGTLFRFGLRTPEQASVSEISHIVYDHGKVVAMLQAFEEAAPEMMLFLRTVAEIEMYTWEAGAAKPTLVHATRVENARGSNKVAQRDGIQKLPQPLNLASIKRPRDYTATVLLNITSATFGGGGATASTASKSTTTTWLVRQSLGDGTSMQLATSQLATQYEVSLLPWGGMAMQMDGGVTPAVVEGRAYVFLPLPAKTELPIHINGFFEVSENRRDVWYGNDMHGAGKFRSDWNVALLDDVIARTYAEILLECTKSTDATQADARQAYYAMLPNTATMVRLPAIFVFMRL